MLLPSFLYVLAQLLCPDAHLGLVFLAEETRFHWQPQPQPHSGTISPPTHLYPHSNILKFIAFRMPPSASTSAYKSSLGRRAHVTYSALNGLFATVGLCYAPFIFPRSPSLVKGLGGQARVPLRLLLAHLSPSPRSAGVLEVLRRTCPAGKRGGIFCVSSAFYASLYICMYEGRSSFLLKSVHLFNFTRMCVCVS